MPDIDLTQSAIDWFDVLNEPIWVFDTESLVIITANRAACRLVGRDRADLLKQTIADIRPKEDRAAIRRMVDEFDKPAQDAGRWRIVRADGGEVTVRFHWQLARYEGRRVVLASLRDDTELVEVSKSKKLAVARLESVERENRLLAEEFQTLFESSPCNSLALRPGDYEIVAVSDAYLAATLKSREDVIGKRFFDVFSEDPAEPDADGPANLRASLRRVEALKQPDVMPVQRYPVKRPDGSFAERFWTSVNHPVIRRNGELSYIIHRVEDVTGIVHSGLADRLPKEWPDSLSRQVRAAVSGEQRLRNALTRSEEQAARLRTVERLLKVGQWEFDPETRQSNWSDRVFEIYGCPGRQTAPDFEEYVDLVHPDDREEVIRTYNEFFEAGATQISFRHRVLGEDGAVRHIRGVGERHDNFGKEIVVGIVEDVSDRHATERELAFVQNLIRLAGKKANLGGWRLDLTTSEVYWSDETALIHQMPPGTKTDLENSIAFYAEGDRDRVRQAFLRAAEHGEPFDLVAKLRTAKGNLIWVQAIGEAERNDRGSIVALRGALQNINDLVEARSRAERVQQELAATLEQMQDAFLTLDGGWNITFVNGLAVSLLGRDRRDLEGKNLWEFFPEAIGTVFERECVRAMERRRVSRFRQHLEALDLWADVSAHPAPGGLAIYFRDISDQIRKEERLKQSQQMFQIVSEITNDFVWEYDVPNDAWKRNARHRALLGLDSEGAPTSFAETLKFVHPEDRALFERSFRDALAGGGGSWELDYRILEKNGHVRFVENLAAIIRDQNGDAIRVVGGLTDVTEVRQLDRRIRESQKMEAVGQLTGGVAHDFNNLLTIILGNSEELAFQLKEHAKLRVLAETTMAAAERGADLTSRLLSFARRQPLEPKVFNLNQHLNNLEEMLRRTLPESISMEFVQSDGLWLVELDPGQLDNAILNLAINSRDAMPAGGTLTIETANVVLDRDYADRHEDLVPGQYVVVSVSDSGKGMDVETRQQVFTPFFTTKEKGKGSGLGLSMVFGFTKQSRGHVNIYSEPDEGTTVKLYFPRSGADAPPDSLPTDASAENTGSEHIFVVEDDELVREHLKRQLETLGYRVTTAENGSAALRYMMEKDLTFDLLLSDVIMPGGMNGQQLADAACKLQPDLKVLFTSGYTDNAMVHQGRLRAGVHMLAKPYRQQVLARKVREVLDE